MKRIVVLLSLVLSFSALSAEVFEGFDKDEKWNGPCKRYETVQQCQNQRVCRMVCSAATAGVAGQVCQEVCEVVPKCSPMIVCVEYY